MKEVQAWIVRHFPHPDPASGQDIGYDDDNDDDDDDDEAMY